MYVCCVIDEKNTEIYQKINNKKSNYQPLVKILLEIISHKKLDICYLEKYLYCKGKKIKQEIIKSSIIVAIHIYRPFILNNLHEIFKPDDNIVNNIVFFKNVNNKYSLLDNTNASIVNYSYFVIFFGENKLEHLFKFIDKCNDEDKNFTFFIVLQIAISTSDIWLINKLIQKGKKLNINDENLPHTFISEIDVNISQDKRSFSFKFIKIISLLIDGGFSNFNSSGSLPLSSLAAKIDHSLLNWLNCFLNMGNKQVVFILNKSV